MTGPEQEDDGRVEDVFRRAAFNWAVSTKRLVESSYAIGMNKGVAAAALADIEHARDMLNSLFVPRASVPDASRVTAAEVRSSASGLAERLGAPDRVLSDEELASVSHLPKSKTKSHPMADLNAPVYSKNGKMLWASIECTDCTSVATERCRKVGGGFMEKPHPSRKVRAEAADMTAWSKSEEQNPA